MGYASVLETVAVFHKPDNLQDAIDELMRSGFDRADLSFAASEKSSKKNWVIGTGKLPNSRTIWLFPGRLMWRLNPSTKRKLPLWESLSTSAPLLQPASCLGTAGRWSQRSKGPLSRARLVASWVSFSPDTSAASTGVANVSNWGMAVFCYGSGHQTFPA